MTALATTTLAPTVGSIRALGAYLTFDLRRAIRNRRYAMFAIGFPVIFYLLYTGILLGGAKPADFVIAWRGEEHSTYNPYDINTATPQIIRWKEL